jgi:type IV secretory pathway TrbF-like protein
MQTLADAKVKKPPLNPYLDARRQHASESARAHSVARFSQALCLLALLIVLAALSAIAYLGSQSKFVPYVVQMDRYGAVTPLGPAESVARTDPRVIQWSVGSFVSSWRMVTPDAAIQTNAVYQVYSMLRERDPAKRKINDFFNKNEKSLPLERAKTETVSVQISPPVRIAGSDSWQVDWSETVYDRQTGEPKEGPYRMRATLQVYLAPIDKDTKSEDFLRNPVGVFIQDLDWTRLF